MLSGQLLKSSSGQVLQGSCSPARHTAQSWGFTARPLPPSGMCRAHFSAVSVYVHGSAQQYLEAGGAHGDGGVGQQRAVVLPAQRARPALHQHGAAAHGAQHGAAHHHRHELRASLLQGQRALSPPAKLLAK